MASQSDEVRVLKTVEYTVELLIRERSKGKSLKQLEEMFGRGRERVRRDLARYDPAPVTLLPENTVATKLGYPQGWLIRLRKGGLINPIRPGGYWLYSEEQVRQIPSLIAEARKCEHCGNPRPLGSRRFCRECSQYRKKHRYITLNLEGKAEHAKRSLAWRKANPERWKEIQSRAYRKYWARQKRMHSEQVQKGIADLSRGSNSRKESIVSCPGCFTIETLWFRGDTLETTKRFSEDSDGKVYHDCGSQLPCRLFLF